MAEQGARDACGPGDTYCSQAIDSSYDNVLRADPCAIDTSNSFDSAREKYLLWMPKYQRKPCEGSGYQHCATGNLGPQQITQESFLQGRGQVSANPSCAASGVKYLPQSEFGERKARAPDMSLFAQPTVLPRSCGSLTEVDMQKRLDRLPAAWQGSYAPLANASRDDRRTMTLGSKNKYPEWGDLKQLSEPYTR
jgi:hypothetical protein